MIKKDNKGRFMKGSSNAWNKGIKGYTNRGSFVKGKTKPQRKELNPNWKGDKVCYGALHTWINRNLGKPKECNFCGQTKVMLHWANINHKYERKFEDYIPLCVVCHKGYDSNFRRQK